MCILEVTDSWWNQEWEAMVWGENETKFATEYNLGVAPSLLSNQIFYFRHTFIHFLKEGHYLKYNTKGTCGIFLMVSYKRGCDHGDEESRVDMYKQPWDFRLYSSVDPVQGKIDNYLVKKWAHGSIFFAEIVQPLWGMPIS